MNNLSLANESVNAPGAGNPTFAGLTARVPSDPQFGSRRAGWRSQEFWCFVLGILIARQHVRRKLFGGTMSWEVSPNECVANVGGSEEAQSPERLGYLTGLRRRGSLLVDGSLGFGSLVKVTLLRVTSK